MKKKCAAGFLILVMIGLTGCGHRGNKLKDRFAESQMDSSKEGSETGSDSDTKTDSPDYENNYREYVTNLDGNASIQSQLRVMAESWSYVKDHLTFDPSFYQYTVADLDRNGRYELILTTMSGSGYFSYSSFFEVNETYDGIVLCDTSFSDYESQPDILENQLETYWDKQGNVHYIVYDYLRGGISASDETMYDVIMKDQEITAYPMGHKSSVMVDPELEDEITCEDLHGNEITLEAYENLPAEKFQGYWHITTTMGWQDCSDLDGNPDSMIPQFQNSLYTFLGLIPKK